MSPWKFALVAAVAVMAFSTPVLALETGQCLPAAQVRGALAAENQSPVVLGTRNGFGSASALIFTSSPDGTRGYLLRGDKPLGQQAETICIDSVYHDLRLNNVNRPGVPSWALMTEDADVARADCVRERLGYQEDCQPHNESLAAMERNGSRVMLIAMGTAINPRDGSVRNDQRLIVAVSAAEMSGLVLASTAEGASYVLSGYSGVSYTQHGQAMLAATD